MFPGFKIRRSTDESWTAADVFLYHNDVTCDGWRSDVIEAGVGEKYHNRFEAQDKSEAGGDNLQLERQLQRGRHFSPGLGILQLKLEIPSGPGI